MADENDKNIESADTAPPWEAGGSASDGSAPDASASGGRESGSAREQTATFPRGTQLAHFLVVDQLGSGGMGTVVAAYDPKLDRKVAIKVLRGSVEEGQHRLLREAQAMARLSHPNVITVYEVGTVGSRVFIAMEHVQGQTLTRWLAEKKRSWREVVDIFVRAGRGLAAAHDAGLVHRDFKPDNVLVGDDGRVRVTDFGLVSAIGEMSERKEKPVSLDRSALTVSLTRTGAVMGTPVYMAPEQREGVPADARADQFSFCVALFEGLYGDRPFAGDTLTELIDNVGEGKLRQPPRDTEVPSWLRATLVRGLAVEPQERHPDMHALLSALQADPSASRRRLLGIAGVALLAAIAIFGLVRSKGTESRLCRDADSRLAGVWDERVKQEVRTAFMATDRPYASETYAHAERVIDRYALDWVAQRVDACEATHVRGEQSSQLLDLRMQCLDERLGELGALTELFAKGPDADVMDRSVPAAFELTSLDRCADAAALTAAVPPPADATTRGKVELLRERIGAAEALRRAGKYSDGLRLATAIELDARDLSYSPIHADALALLASLQGAQGDSEAAEATLLELVRAAADSRDDDMLAYAWIDLVYVVGHGLARYRDAITLLPVAEAAVARAGDGAALRAALHSGLGVLARDSGRYVEARRHFEEAITIRQELLGPDHPDVGAALTGLGSVLDSLGQFDEALQSHERALAIAEKSLGKDHPQMAARLFDLGVVLQSQARYDEAKRYFERAFQIAEQAFGPDHIAVAGALTNLGNLHMARGDYAEARRLYDRALTIKRKVLGEGHPGVGLSLGAIGSLLAAQGQYEEAVRYQERSLAIYVKTFGPDHPEVASHIGNLGNLAHDRGDYEAAQKHLERALAIGEKALGPNHPDVGLVLNNLGAVLLITGKPDQARAYQERALAILESSYGPDHPRIAACLNNLGNVSQAMGDNDEARRYQERALAVKERSLGPDHPHVATTLNNLGDALYSQGKLDEAEPYLRRALEIWEKQLGPDHADVGIAVHNLGNVYADRGDFDKARKYQERARDIFTKAVGEDHPYVAYPLTGLGEALHGAGRASAAVEPLERALAIREAGRVAPMELAKTRFALARALWDSKADRKRAVSLAKQARTAYAAGKQAGDSGRKKVDAWLRQHGAL